MLSYKTKSSRYTCFIICSYMRSQVECQAHPLLRARNHAQIEVDEIAKIPPSRWDSSYMVSGSGFGESNIPQNLGTGQKVTGHDLTNVGMLWTPEKCGQDVI